MTIEETELAQIDQELAARIDPWLAHMRWRPNFDNWRQARLHQEDHQKEALRLLEQGRALAHSPALEQSSMLDLGCGMGGFAVAVARKGIKVTALDYNPAYCAITAVRAARYKLALPVAAAAGEAIPLPDASYDIVTCWDVLEHVQKPRDLLKELNRVLRPGGLLLITAINRFAFKDPHYHLPLINWMPRPLGESLIALSGRRKGGAFRDKQRLSEMHYYTWKGLKQQAAECGFRLYDLDEERVARGEVGARKRWRRLASSLGVAVPAYRAYRNCWQGTWRLAMIKEA
jgi:2-polyprenyl-3-methyl-5-hydroxy-6-metoxy-1,4-benzoquinol methylase